VFTVDEVAVRRYHSTPGVNWPRPRTRTRPTPCADWQFRSQVKIDQRLECLHRPVASAAPPAPARCSLEFVREKLQRCDQHRRFGIKVESDDARRHFSDRHHFFHRGARRTMRYATPRCRHRSGAGADGCAIARSRVASGATAFARLFLPTCVQRAANLSATRKNMNSRLAPRMMNTSPGGIADTRLLSDWRHRRRHGRSSREFHGSATDWLIIAPPLLFLIVFFLIPFAFALKISFAETRQSTCPPTRMCCRSTPDSHLHVT
jgi:hypothetical protein